MVRECGFIILSKACRDFTGIIGLQRMPGWALGEELLKKWSFRLLEKSPLVLFPNEKLPFCSNRRGQRYPHLETDAVCIIISEFIPNCKTLCSLGGSYENKGGGERVERGEVTLRSNVVPVYRNNLPHSKLLRASAASGNVSDFYTTKNLVVLLARVTPKK